MNKIGGVSHFSFISLFQSLTCLIHILCMHHMKGKVGKVCWERQQPLLQRSSTGKLHKCIGATTAIAAYCSYGSFRARKTRIVPSG